MKKIIGAAAAAFAIVTPVVAVAQPFATCTDASNYGHNMGDLLVGSVMTRLACDQSGLANTETAIVEAVASTVPGWEAPPEQIVCYYEGFYGAIISRMEREYAACKQQDPSFPALSARMVGDTAVAALSAIMQSVQLTPAQARTIFNADYRFLPKDVAGCRRSLKAAEAARSQPRSWRPLLAVIEEELCVNPGPPR